MTWQAWLGIFLLSMKRNHDVDAEDLTSSEWKHLEQLYREGARPEEAVWELEEALAA